MFLRYSSFSYIDTARAPMAALKRKQENIDHPVTTETVMHIIDAATRCPSDLTNYLEIKMSYLDRDTHGIYHDDSTDAGSASRLMGAHTLIGEDVYNRQDESLGDIKEFMLDIRSGQIAYAVLSFGGWLGMGSKLFAVPWQSMELDRVNKRFVLDSSKEQLKNAPGFDTDNWPDMASTEFATQIHGFYGTQQNQLGQRTSSGSVMGSGSGTMQSGSPGSGALQGGSLSGSSGNLSGTDDLNRPVR